MTVYVSFLFLNCLLKFFRIILQEESKQIKKMYLRGIMRIYSQEKQVWYLNTITEKEGLLCHLYKNRGNSQDHRDRSVGSSHSRDSPKVPLTHAHMSMCLSALCSFCRIHLNPAVFCGMHKIISCFKQNHNRLIICLLAIWGMTGSESLFYKFANKDPCGKLPSLHSTGRYQEDKAPMLELKQPLFASP